jgi:hypothetical protein
VRGRATRGEHEKGALVPTGGGQRGQCGVSAQWGGVESLMSGAQLAAGEGGRRERRGARVGQPRKNELGRAQMNSDNFELFKWISNEFDLF